jgi:uncharacterized caspase-like protein
MTLALAFVACGFAVAQTAAAEARVALIIGNSAYRDPTLHLPNPANDAAAMARALQATGFETIVQLDATRQKIWNSMNVFADKLRERHAVGLFYYAGHAVQANGINWLIPVDAEIKSEQDLEPNAFDAARMVKAMSEAGNEVNIVILDACRDNPLPKTTRSIVRGLTRIDPPTANGIYIIYAAAPGRTAEDGAAGTNSVFTGEFIKAMAKPGLKIEDVFKDASEAVDADTKGAQIPWAEGSIRGKWFLIPADAGSARIAGSVAAAQSAKPNAPSVGPKVDTAAEVEQSFWNRIKDSRDLADFRDYKTQYPSGIHLAEADLLIRRLGAPTAANKVPVTPPPVSTAVPQSMPADSKIALVIGNAHYADTAPLSRPIPNAETIARSLRKDGFIVSTDNDATHAAMQRDFERLREVRNAKTVLIYYTGNSFRFNDQHYLVPVDAHRKDLSSLAATSFPIGGVLQMLDGAARTAALIIDACGLDPNIPYSQFFPYGRETGISARDSTITFNAKNPILGYLILSNSCRNGDSGADHESPFTLSLARHMVEPDFSLMWLANSVDSDGFLPNIHSAGGGLNVHLNDGTTGTPR